MSYNYSNEGPFIFTDEGQRMLLKVRDKAKKLNDIAGAFTISSAISGCTGNSWSMLACIDRLVELGELECVSTKYSTQEHVYICQKITA